MTSSPIISVENVSKAYRIGLKEESPAENNNLGAIRAVLASLVVFSHSFPLSLGKDSPDPLGSMIPGYSLGQLAVEGFFLISGFLITKSWLSRRSASTFLKRRILRLYPGYYASLILTVVLVVLAGSDDRLAYLKSFYWNCSQLPETLLFLHSDLFSRGPCFLANPFPMAANGSLWTLAPEAMCYLTVAGFGVLRLIERKSFLLIFFSALFVLYGVWVIDLGESPTAFLRLITFFSTGMMFYIYRELIPLTTRSGLIIASLCPILGMLSKPIFTLTIPLAGGYTLFSLAFMSRVYGARFFRGNDWSYGIYVYSFPLQQAMVSWFGIRSPLVLFVTSFPCVVILGWLSWRFIEKPCLSLRLD